MKKSLFNLVFGLGAMVAFSFMLEGSAARAAPTAFDANSPADAIGSETAVFSSPDGATVLNQTAANVRTVFEDYVPAVDSSSKIVSPKQVTGPSNTPRLQLGIQACVFIVCRTVDLDADVKIESVSGSCQQNLLLTADLTRSTDLLANNYNRLEVSICLNQSGSAQYNLDVRAAAVRAPGYSSGPITSNALRFLKMQVAPMLQALNQTLTQFGAQNLSAH